MDRDCEGELREFESEEAFLSHEEESYARRLRGEHPRKYETVPSEQRALLAAINSYADERGEAALESAQVIKDEILKELKALGEQSEQHWERERASRTAGEVRFALRELIHDSLTAEMIRTLLGTKAIDTQGRRKSALANTAAMCFSASEIQEFLSRNSTSAPRNGDDSPAAKEAKTIRKRGGTGGFTQTKLPVTKRMRRANGEQVAAVNAGDDALRASQPP